VRRFEITEENETLRTVVLRDMQPDAPIEDDVFSFTPPAGTDVFAG
jgi:outer membrane lipoprotein-sorting protein